MVPRATLGLPRIGPRRELKRALERYWMGDASPTELLAAARELRAERWQLQRQAGIDVIASNDFSLYDHVLDTTLLLGAEPERFAAVGEPDSLERYFAMARGSANCAALELTKWFDTNYHYLVPELSPGQRFELRASKPLNEYAEATALGIETRPVLLGPVSWLLLAKSKHEHWDRLNLLPSLLPVYAELLTRLGQAGAYWVQIDEPCLVTDLSQAEQSAYQAAYATLSEVDSVRLMLTTYFGPLADNLALAASLPVAGLHIDAVRGRDQVEEVARELADDCTLSLGVVDGRNVYKTDLGAALDLLTKVVNQRGAQNLQLAPSCSLLHVPLSLQAETSLDPEVRRWLAFAEDRLDELGVLATALDERTDEVRQQLSDNARDLYVRKLSKRVHRDDVKARLEALTPDDTERHSPFPRRREQQRRRLKLPDFPTTTIGSFPQTSELRLLRAHNKRGALSDAEYQRALERTVVDNIRLQERLGLDVLVHGEPERNDMVEYFGEKLVGVVTTENGWVQSYGSRCVKPPIIYGDVARDTPMTVQWTQFAQVHTEHPVKGMLTGPVTLLKWSFVRDDQPLDVTCRQLALAIRDETLDLERHGIQIIQVDEPAFREALPLRRAQRDRYLDWAVECFQLATSGVTDATQIHTHMCYCEFNDIIDAIARLDADVISLETSRSDMELLGAFADFAYPNELGPGVYDVHSPSVPSVEAMERLVHAALRVLSPEQVWINPDCGLKTRSWQEVRPALENLVAVARRLRANRTATARQSHRGEVNDQHQA